MPDWMTYIGAIKATTAGPKVFIDPSSIANLALWLDANSGVYQDSGFAVLCTGGDLVGGWQDRSANTNHVLQLGSTKPSFSSAVFNGKNSITFLSVNNYLANLAANSTDLSNFTFFVVITRSDATTSAPIVIGPIPGGRGFGFRPSAVNTTSFTKAGTAVIASGNTAILPQSLAAGTPFLFSLDYNSLGTANLYLNNSADSTTQNLQTFTAGSSITVGSSISYLGRISEIIYYNTVLSASTRNQISQYLAAKYAMWGT